MGTIARPKIHFFDPRDKAKPVRSVQTPKTEAPEQPKTQYWLTNWPTYNQALIQRGSLQLWVDEDTLQNWCYQSPQKPGGELATFDWRLFLGRFGAKLHFDHG